MTVDTLTREDTGIFAALSTDVERIYRPLDKHLTHYRRELDALFAADLDELIRDADPETMEWPPFPDAADTPADDEPDPVQAYFDADDSDEMPGRAVVPGDGIPVLAAAYRGERRFVPDPADYGPHEQQHPDRLVITENGNAVIFRGSDDGHGRYRGPRSPLWQRVDRALQWLEQRFTPTKEKAE